MSTLHLNGKPDKVSASDYGKTFAFPFILQIPNPLNLREIQVHVNQGVTIRDYFAAKAMAACNGTPLFDSAREVAGWCYRIADAMLEARIREKSAEPVSDSPTGSQFHGDYLKK